MEIFGGSFQASTTMSTKDNKKQEPESKKELRYPMRNSWKGSKDLKIQKGIKIDGYPGNLTVYPRDPENFDVNDFKLKLLLNERKVKAGFGKAKNNDD